MKIDKKKNFLIVGLGLMGGSYAERLTQQGYKVYALDINLDSIKIGKKRRIILNKNESEEELIRSADYIILALTPKLCPIWIEKNVHLIKKDAIVTDMMGVKSHLVDDIQKTLNEIEFISMHPMTGKELSGVMYSSSNIFNSSNIIVVPTSKNTQRGIDFAFCLASELKAKNIKTLSIQEHDRIVGYVSHLSHVISVILMNSFSSKSIVEYAGTSFRDITRIANINEEIWSELFIENKNELIPLIEQFEAKLEELKIAISKSDETKVKKILKESRIKRQEFNSK